MGGGGGGASPAASSSALELTWTAPPRPWASVSPCACGGCGWRCGFSVPAHYLAATGEGPHLAADSGVAPGPLEGLLLTAGTLGQVAGPLRILVVSCWLVALAWTVLWHAGTATSALGDPRRPGLAALLGRGLVAWWRYLRLAVAAAAVTVGAVALLWTALAPLLGAAFRDPGARTGGWLAVGVTVTAILLLLGWAAALRASWLLASPHRRSATVALLDGLLGAIRQPVASFGTLLLWVVPAVAAAALPLIVVAFEPTFAGGWPGHLLTAAAGAVNAAATLALFLSFAPPDAWRREPPPAAPVMPPRPPGALPPPLPGEPGRSAPWEPPPVGVRECSGRVSVVAGMRGDGTTPRAGPGPPVPGPAYRSVSLSRFGPAARISSGQPSAKSLKFSM